jgi:uncharacterized protein YndB with AHSA1/START domain
MHLLFGMLVAMSMTMQAPSSDSLTLEAVIDAPVDAVWDAYTTKSGVESWMASKAEVDLAIGGTLRTHFDPKGTIGDAQTIENRILSFDPRRMLSLRVTRAPADFPYATAIARTWSVVYFTPEGGKTRVSEVTMGFGDDPESQALRKFLEDGNRYLMGQLQKRFAGAAADGRR